jgi:hypothetical protein
MPGIYLYGIIPTRHNLVFETGGIGEDEGGVYTIMREDVAAVVEPSPLPDYRGLPRSEVLRYLIAHQRVVEAVMADYAVLPAEFGTVLPHEGWVERLLEQGEGLFRQTLADLGGRVQMEVTALWDLALVFQEIAREEPIVRLKGELALGAPEATQRGQIALGQMVQASLERRREHLGQRILRRLQTLAQDVVSNPLMDDSMIVNVALLLDPAARHALDECLHLLDKEFEGRLRLRCVGPLPAYSFATVRARLPNLADITAARQRLDLPEVASSAQIRRAYRERAARLHPDHNQEDPDATASMAELTRFHGVLQEYAASQTLRRGETAPCSFAPQSVERTLLLDVRHAPTAAQGRSADRATSFGEAPHGLV